MHFVTICRTGSTAFGYWKSWLEHKGFKHEIRGDWLVRLMDGKEWQEFERA